MQAPAWQVPAKSPGVVQAPGAGVHMPPGLHRWQAPQAGALGALQPVACGGGRTGGGAELVRGTPGGGGGGGGGVQGCRRQAEQGAPAQRRFTRQTPAAQAPAKPAGAMVQASPLTPAQPPPLTQTVQAGT